MLNSILPSRPLEEQMAGYVTVTLGGQRYELPTLTRRENRSWKEALNERMGTALGTVQGTSDPGAIMTVLAAAGDIVVELVRLYDRQGVIPPDDSPALERDTDQEWLTALLACGAAAYPFVGLALEAQRQSSAQPEPQSPTTTPGPEPTNSRPPNGDGVPATSRTS